jgi:hypothetical protein
MNIFLIKNSQRFNKDVFVQLFHLFIKAIQFYLMVATFEIYLTQIAIVIIVSLVTGRDNNYASIASNATISVLAGGTLLFEQRIVGFFLLVYGIFLLTFAVKEYEEKKTRYSDDLTGKIIKFFGHYMVVSSVLVVILFIEYRPETLGFVAWVLGNLAR